MKKLLSKSLSVILTLTMLSSMTAVAVTDAGALSVQNVGEQNPSDSAGKAFSLDEVYTDYLFPQTDKTSEVKYEGTVEKYEFHYRYLLLSRRQIRKKILLRYNIRDRENDFYKFC